MKTRPGKRIASRTTSTFLLLVSIASAGCLHTSGSGKSLEDYLEPPQIPSKATARLYDMSRNFLNSLYERREYHLKFINQDDGRDKSHSIMCVKEIAESIKSFTWPEKYKDLQHERQLIVDHINRELGCTSVVRPIL